MYLEIYGIIRRKGSRYSRSYSNGTFVFVWDNARPLRLKGKRSWKHSPESLFTPYFCTFSFSFSSISQLLMLLAC